VLHVCLSLIAWKASTRVAACDERKLVDLKPSLGGYGASLMQAAWYSSWHEPRGSGVPGRPETLVGILQENNTNNAAQARHLILIVVINASDAS
jgi:hypothetical protein